MAIEVAYTNTGLASSWFKNRARFTCIQRFRKRSGEYETGVLSHFILSLGHPTMKMKMKMLAWDNFSAIGRSTVNQRIDLFRSIYCILVTICKGWSWLVDELFQRFGGLKMGYLTVQIQFIRNVFDFASCKYWEMSFIKLPSCGINIKLLQASLVTAVVLGEDPIVCFFFPTCTTQKTTKYLLTSMKLRSLFTNQPCVQQILVKSLRNLPWQFINLKYFRKAIYFDTRRTKRDHLVKIKCRILERGRDICHHALFSLLLK